MNRYMQNAVFQVSWVIFTCLSISGWGQVVSPLGRFEVDYVKGCAPLTVNVTNLTGNSNALYLFDGDICNPASPNYNPATCTTMTPTVVTEHTYSDPGVYTVIEFDLNEIPREDILMIEVLPSQPPEYHLTLCNNYGAHINIIDTYYDQFLIDYGDGSPLTSARNHIYPPGNTSYPVTVSGYFNNGPVNCGSVTTMITPVNSLPPATISQVTVLNQVPNSGQIHVEYQLSPNVRYILQSSANGTASFTNVEIPTGTSRTFLKLNTLDSTYCYRIATQDRCSNTRTYSNTVCSTSIEVLAQNGQNQVNWNTVLTPEFNRYEVDKNGSPLGPPINISTIQGSTDTDVECNVSYCYQVTTVNNDGGRSVSLKRCVNGINNSPPPKIDFLTATVDGGNIVLDWNLTTPINFYRVFRSTNNGPFEAIGQGTTLPFTDPNLRPQINDYCYHVIYQNACGVQSEPSITACVMKLTGLNESRDYLLDWTPYSGWTTGVLGYQLEIMDETGALIGPPVNLNGITTSYSDPITQNRQISQYRVVAISRDPVPFRSYSNVIRVDHPLQIFVPNSFTPNNDGLNDTFRAKGLFIEEFTMEIYSRWGELLFHTSDLEQGWDGIYRGTLSPEDAYAFKINATDPNGRQVIKSGTVNLLRKDY